MIARAASLLGALVLSAAVLYASALGAGPLPPLGTAFNPGTGAWTSAADSQLPHNETLAISGLHRAASVTFEPNGVAHIYAQDDHDAMVALGYLHARFRLFQMDLERRQGEGRLSAVFGKAALPTDRFELQLGLARTAQTEWDQLDAASRDLLLAYTAGVNDRIAENHAKGDWPMLFRLVGYQPEDWEPRDTLVVQGDETQDLDFQTTPVTYALLAKSLGFERTKAWFPVIAPVEQHPYDAGPYRHDAAASIASMTSLEYASAPALKDLEQRMRALPASVLPPVPNNSNNWAVDSTKSASGKPMLAGDPHLALTLPSIWFQVTIDSPSLHVAGVSIPGTPGVVIGHNQHIAWSLTDTENAATFYYQEKTDTQHPDQYFWNGAWRRYRHVRYDIPVKGGAADPLDVKVTVHGPVMTQKGATYSVWWAGALPSPDLKALNGVARARNFAEFREALKSWYAPSQNFIYADDAGHIGLIGAGYYPIVASGDPWLPLSGTGGSDVVGAIPFDDIPQAYDPPAHYTFSANQRPVSAQYPYYVGTVNDFEPGFRAAEINRLLSTTAKVSMQDMQALQNDTRDDVASLVVPRLLPVINGRTGADLLGQWDYRMDTNSSAATIWWAFWTHYLDATFGPWWRTYNVGVSRNDVLYGLTEALLNWTENDPNNAAFTPPGAAHRSAADVMRSAYDAAIADLEKQHGSDPGRWTWGTVHERTLNSLALIESLAYGPRAAPGDEFTVDRGSVGLSTGEGPSWRMIVDWGGGDLGVYPGGQSENPVSSWYSNRAPKWWDGRYDPMLLGTDVSAANTRATWRLSPSS